MKYTHIYIHISDKNFHIRNLNSRFMDVHKIMVRNSEPKGNYYGLVPNSVITIVLIVIKTQT